MRNYSAPSIDPFTSYDNIAKAKRGDTRTILARLAPTIRNRFSDYCDVLPHMAGLTPFTFTSEEKLALTDCYVGKTVARDEMLAQIRRHQPTDITDQCQYCGIGFWDTFDHYVPKTMFPEFSALSINLMPCCYRCNLKKMEALFKNNKRQILNLYYDRLPTEQYLFAKIIFMGEVPIATYSLVRPDSIVDDFFELISAHYKQLNLLVRYRENSSRALSNTRSLIQEHERKLTRERVAEYLIEEADRLGRIYSSNHRNAVLHREMARDVSYIASCCA